MVGTAIRTCFSWSTLCCLSFGHELQHMEFDDLLPVLDNYEEVYSSNAIDINIILAIAAIN